MRDPSVSIIILNYNGYTNLGNKIIEYLDSVMQTDYPDFEVIFADNGSNDESIKIIQNNFRSSPELKIFRLDKNYGYAEGNNKSVKSCRERSEYLAFLNNDIKVQPDWLKPMIEEMEKDPKIGILGGKILKVSDGSVDSAGGFIDRYGFSYIRKNGSNENNIKKDVFFVFGSVMIIRRNIFETCKGFDENFFLQNEEIDLCWRVHLRGYKVVYISDSISFHDSGASTSKVPSPVMSFHSSKNRLSMLIKNYSTPNALIYTPILILIYLIYFIYLTLKGNIKIGVSYIKAIWWNIKYISQTLEKRREIQRSRIVKDQDLFRSKFIIEPRLGDKLNGRNEF